MPVQGTPERETPVGHWRASFDAVRGRRGRGGRDSGRQACGGGVVAQQVSVMALMVNTVLTLLANICHPRKEKCEPKVM